MSEQLQALDNDLRLQVYNQVLQGCTHLWSKGKLQIDKLNSLLDVLVPLTIEDPLFLAHLTSYAIKKLDRKDLKVVATFVNALNDGDGTPFSPGSKYTKPTLRMVSKSAIQELSPKEVSRVMELANVKQKLNSEQPVRHFPTFLRTAIKKYIRYRETNLKSFEGIKKAGMSNIMKNMYRQIHLSPTTEVAQILNWQQKVGDKFEKKTSIFEFDGLDDTAVAEKIQSNKLSPIPTLGALDRKMSPVIAVAILEQCTGDQALVLQNAFKDQGILNNKEVLVVFETKIKSAKSLDKVERINSEVSESVKKILNTSKATKRKETVGNIGKMFIHLDVSPSMRNALVFAKDKGAILAECVIPENFNWGTFHDRGKILPTPDTFEKAAFEHALYGVTCGGMGTDCLALYRQACEMGCNIQVFVTDEEHNGRNIGSQLKHVHEDLSLPKPNAIVIINTDAVGYQSTQLGRAFETYGIPVARIEPSTLTESALVAQSIKVAMKGSVAIIDEIMEQPLLQLPKWWSSVSVNKKIAE